jgi:small subunit ribosomal protein S3Ae
MAKAKAKVAVVKAKKKNWHSIMSPASMGTKMLGETYVESADAAVGRTVQFNLKDITNNIRDQNAYVQFSISAVAGSNLQTSPIGYYMNPAAIKKLSRRKTSRIDDSFIVSTKDSKKLRVKIIAITLNIIPAALRAEMRKSIQQHIARSFGAVEFTELLGSIMYHKLQAETKKKLSKLYPLKAFEVKVLEFAKEGKKAVKATADVEEENVAEEKPKKKVAKKEKKSVSEEMVEELESSEKLDASTSDDSEEFGEE